MSKKSRILNNDKDQKRKSVFETKFNDLIELLELNKIEIDKIKTKKKTLSLLESVSNGLYIETEKLCKKNPNLIATNLIVEQVNQVIKETKETIEDDSYIDRLNQFVPAGENPEIQDIVIVLKQITQGLIRYKGKPDDTLKIFIQERDLMEFLHSALEYLLEDNEEPAISDFENSRYYLSWFSSGYFNFSKLEQTNLFDYFEYAVKGE